MKPIYYKIPMQDGSEEDLTLNLGALYELRKKHKELSDRYFKLYKKMQSKDFNELDMGELFYIAYACAHPNEKIMRKEEFLCSITDSREEHANIFQQMFGVKKNEALPTLSKEQHEEKGQAQ